MDPQEQNWKNLTAKHLRDWHGIWTRYDAQGEVTEYFRSLRSFSSDRAQTEIVQRNLYMYPEGNTEEKSWEFNQGTHSLPDGLFHPASSTGRGVFLASGHAGWVTTQLKTDSYFGAELFFMHEELRPTVVIVYDEQGNLLRTTNIREDAAGFPSQYWSTELQQLPDRNLSGNWQGTSVTITPDLKISEPVPSKLHWNWEGHHAFFLPDGVSISCPDRVIVGSPFILAANWLVTPSDMHELILKYDESGAFYSLTLDLLHLI